MISYETLVKIRKYSGYSRYSRYNILAKVMMPFIAEEQAR